MGKSLIDINGVTKVFNEPVVNQVLFGIDLQVGRGEFCSLVGASGSGKSTLLNIIGALDRPTNGSISIDGVKMDSLDDNELAFFRNQSIGFIFQFHFLLPQFTVIENVLIPHLIYHGYADKTARMRAEELLERVEMSHRRDNKSNAISGGEQQRVAIARALINQPHVVLADEPTGNLDSKNGARVFDLLREINQEYQTTFILVTHDQGMALKCDRIIELKDGRVVCDQMNKPEDSEG
ncbi:MAG: ABC transporter ATP-binding protein [Syntrophomonas sp.]